MVNLALLAYKYIERVRSVNYTRYLWHVPKPRQHL